MPSIESNPLIIASRSSVFPKGWFDPSERARDPLVELKERFAELKQKVSEFDELAAKHVYHNPNLSMIDIRQHRWLLHYLLYNAEELALGFEILKRPEDTAGHVASLDGEIQRLENIFHDWHGNPEAHADTPESFKQAMREVKAGQTEEMEEKMFAADTTPET